MTSGSGGERSRSNNNLIMGTRVNVLLEHDLADFRDRATVLRRLDVARPALLDVRAYWHAADPQTHADDHLTEWRAGSCEQHLCRYTAPGSLFLEIMSRTARLRGGARWRGFLGIEALRHVHLTAFHHLAQALGSHSMAIYADSCDIDDLFWGGATQWECIEQMEQLWGPAQKCVDQIDVRVVAAAERTVPLVWFLENVTLT